jgi:hypothetical protein
MHEESVEEEKSSDEDDDEGFGKYVLPSHEQLKSSMSFHEAFFALPTLVTNPPPHDQQGTTPAA